MTRHRTWLQAGALAVLLLLFFAALERRSGFYFLQDDNRDYTLPLWLGSYRALADGQIGEFNFYQSLGMPLLASGQTGGLTPFSYVSIGLSSLLLHHPYGAVEIAVLLYFLVGGFGFLALARELEMRRAAGLFGAIAWTFNPFNVYVAVSWVHIAPLVAFLPWIFALLLRHYRRPSLASLLGFATVHVLLLFTGYMPWLMFLALFEVALVGVLVAGDLRRGAKLAARHSMAWLLLVPLLIGGLGAPLLMPFVHQMSASAHRSTSMEYFDFASQVVRPSVWLNGLLQPLRRLYEVEKYTPNGFLEIGSPPAITHLGYLTLAFSCFAFYGWRKRSPNTRIVLAAIAGLGLLALLWSFGWFSPVLFHAPLFNRLRWPFRVLAFANFFVVILGAAGFDRACGLLVRRHRGAIVAALLALHATNLAAVNLLHHQRGFFEHTDTVPLASPPAPFDQSGRILTIGLMTPFGRSAPTAETLAFDYATLWQLYQFGGYETMMPTANWRASLGLNHASPQPSGASFIERPQRLPLSYLRAWGVRWYVVTDMGQPAYGPFFQSQGLRLVHRGTQTTVYQDDAAQPMGWWNEGKGDLKLEVGTDAISIDVESPSGGTVAISFLYNPFFEAAVDGEPAAIGVNQLGQMLIAAPAGTHRVRLDFHDPYFRQGRSLAAIALALFAIAWIGLPRLRSGNAPTVALSE